MATLALSSLTLSPTFDPNVYAYTTNSTSATNTLTATAADSGATITTKLNNVTFTGSTVTWTENTDTLEVKCNAGTGFVKTYTITCTHTT